MSKPAKTIRVILVDDHALVRQGIKRLLEDVPNIKIVAEADNGEEALKIVRQHPVDVAIIDVNMPGIGGLETTRRLLRTAPEIKILILSAYDDGPVPSRLLQLGASGYLTKGSGLEEMINAIISVHAGQHYINPAIAQQLALQRVTSKPDSPFETLSEREMQVMIMITKGEKVGHIAEQLCLSPKTVNSYRYRLFEKLGVNNDVELTHLALRYGVVHVETQKE